MGHVKRVPVFVSAHRIMLEIVHTHRDQYHFVVANEHEPIKDLPCVQTNTIHL